MNHRVTSLILTAAMIVACARAEDLPTGYSSDLLLALKGLLTEDYGYSIASSGLSPEEFVRTCDFWRADLDDDGQSEVIVYVRYGAGQKGNSIFYVLQKKRGDWHSIGRVYGNNSKITRKRVNGYLVLAASAYGGGGRYTATNYVYKHGSYRAAIIP